MPSTIPFEPPMFHIVQAVPPGGDGWRAYGVFTRFDDAEALVASINARPEYLRTAMHERMSFETLQELIFADRVGKLAPLIAMIEQGEKARTGRG